MKKAFFAVLLVGFCAFTTQAQRISRVSAGLDVGTGFGPGNFSPSLLYYQTLQPANAPWIRLTGGARVWNYQAQDTYLTAPGGRGVSNPNTVSSENQQWHGKPQSVRMNLPPLGVVVLKKRG
jgi:hypothetical protein